MSKLVVNTVMEYKSIKEKIRIVYINSSYEYLYVIKLLGECPAPKYMLVKDIIISIENEELIEVDDPFNKYINEIDIPERHRKQRDKYYNIVSDLWYKDREKILDRNVRGELIRKIFWEHSISEKTVLRLITRFWQRGMSKNSLLPDYVNSKLKGKEKFDTNKKRGRPRNIEYNETEISGININEDIKQKIKSSLDIFYYNKYKKNLKEAYTCMLERFFSDMYIVDGKPIFKVWKKDRIPTYEQFYYWYRKWNDFEKEYILRNGDKNFELKHRQLLKNSTMENFGPGSRYQVDATIADIYLVSTIHRDKIIGRPIVYIIIDVYSRMILGLYVGLEGPSWIGAMMALGNVVEDKVKFCKQYNIDITEEVWPLSSLPETIIADRGEFEGYNVESLINNLGIRVENTSPYRGDLKGIVERYFRTMNEKIKHTTPGAIQKEFRERGDKDYRLDAILDLKEFTSIIIYQIIHHNSSVIQKYPKELRLIEEEVLSTPIALWNWGKINRYCGFVKVEKDIAKLNILPKARAVITREGIRFKTLYYSSAEAIEDKWFINGNHKSIEIVYDPRILDYIYIPQINGKRYIKCFLLDKCKSFKGLSIEEIIFEKELNGEIIEFNRDNQNQLNLDLEVNIKNIIKQAKEKKCTQSRESKSMRIKNIKKNRNDEKVNNRKNEYYELDSSNEKSNNFNNGNKECKYNSCNNEIHNENKIELLKMIRNENIER